MPGRMLALTFVVCLGFTYGCATQPKGNSDVLAAPSLLSSGGTTPGSVSQDDADWSKLGRQMRGDAPVPQQSFDPLRDLMESPRAQSIDRSLGVDD